MKLNKIDFFAKGNLVIYQDYKIAINPVSGCREDIPCDPVEINSYEELSKRVAHHSDVEHLVLRMGIHHVVAVAEGYPVVLVLTAEHGGILCVGGGHHLFVYCVP